jgi:hypothetical protein
MGLNQKRKSIEYFQEIELCHPVLLSFLNTKMELTNILTDFNWHFKTNEENRYKPILVLYGLKQDIEKMIIEINILLKELTIIKINLNENFDLDLLSKYLDVLYKNIFSWTISHKMIDKISENGSIKYEQSNTIDICFPSNISKNLKEKIIEDIKNIYQKRIIINANFNVIILGNLLNQKFPNNAYHMKQYECDIVLTSSTPEMVDFLNKEIWK